MPSGATPILYPLRKLPKRLCLLRQSVNNSVSCALRSTDYIDDKASDGPSSSHYCDFSDIHSKMRGCAKMGCVQKALETLNYMGYAGGKRSVNDYNALLYYYLKSQHVVFDELVRVHSHMKQFGPSPNALTYNNLVNGMLLLHCLRDALFMVEEMLRSGYVPSFSSLKKLLKRLLRVDNLANSIYVVELMLALNYIPTEPVLNLMTRKLCKVGMIREAYNVLNALLCKVLSRACKQGNFLMIQRLLNQMESQGLDLNGVSVTCLIQYFCTVAIKAKDYVLAEELLIDMCSQSLEPDAVTYGSLISGICKDDHIKVALQLCHQMAANGIKPSVAIYNIMLKTMLRRMMFGDILLLLKDMARNACDPNDASYSILERAISEGMKRNYPEAKKLQEFVKVS